MNVVLVGFAGVGKSTVGKLVADKLGYQFVDVDELIEQTEQSTISSIFCDHGEEYFRNAESAVLGCVAQLNDVVVATGGGAVLSDRFCEIVRNATVVWLTCSADNVMNRLLQGGRPLFDGKSREYVTGIMAERQPLYEQYADVTVSTDDLTAEQVASSIVNIINE